MTSERQPGDAIEAAADSFTAGNQDWRQQRLSNPVAGEELDLMRRRVRIVAAGGPDETCYVPADDMLRLFDTIDQQAERIAQLERERDEARSTNRELHRRVQRIESKDPLMREVRFCQKLARTYSDMWYDTHELLIAAKKDRDEWERRAFQAAEEARERISAATVFKAFEACHFIQQGAQNMGKPFVGPHVTTNTDGELCFEWWRRDRKITFYIRECEPVNCIRVWGANIHDEMRDHEMKEREDYRKAWEWLYSSL